MWDTPLMGMWLTGHWAYDARQRSLPHGLAGQQLQHPQRGINIINHKTVVLK